MFGKSRLRAVTGTQAEKFYAGLLKHYSIHKAAKVMKDFQFLFNRAIRLNVTNYNPGLAFEVQQPKPRKVCRSHDQLETAKRIGWKKGYRGAVVAIAIAYDTTDSRTLTIGELANGTCVGRRNKTDEEYNVELSESTMRLVKTYHGAIWGNTALVIRTRRGAAYTKDCLSRDVRYILRAAGIPDEVQLRNIRRTVATERVEAGVTDTELEAAMGVSDKTSGKRRKTYAPAFETMANNARGKRKANIRGTKNG